MHNIKIRITWKQLRKKSPWANLGHLLSADLAHNSATIKRLCTCSQICFCRILSFFLPIYQIKWRHLTRWTEDILRSKRSIKSKQISKKTESWTTSNKTTEICLKKWKHSWIWQKGFSIRWNRRAEPLLKRTQEALEARCTADQFRPRALRPPPNITMRCQWIQCSSLTISAPGIKMRYITMP